MARYIGYTNGVKYNNFVTFLPFLSFLFQRGSVGYRRLHGGLQFFHPKNICEMPDAPPPYQLRQKAA